MTAMRFFHIASFFLVTLTVSYANPTAVDVTKVTSNGTLISGKPVATPQVAGRAAVSRTASSRTFKYENGVYQGRQVSILYYYNSNGPNYKIAVYGGLPAPFHRMLEWMEKFGQMYNPVRIPPLNGGGGGGDEIRGGGGGNDVRGGDTGDDEDGGNVVKKVGRKKKVGKKKGSKKGRKEGGTGQCGEVRKLVDKVTNGEQVSVAERPWQVGLVQKRTRGAFCGGSLISMQHVITAAHCMVEEGSIKSPTIFQVFAGTTDIYNPRQVSDVRKVFVHAQYDDKILVNDISLLILEQPFKQSEELVPICLPPPTTNYNSGQHCVISGWGRVSKDARSGERMLRSAKVDVLDERDCKGLYRHQLGEKMFCGGDPQKGKGTCYGDSGGPFACKQKGKYYLYGLTSWGIECDSHNYPAVYTRVARYLDWIKERASTRRRRDTSDDAEEEDDDESPEFDQDELDDLEFDDDEIDSDELNEQEEEELDNNIPTE